MPAAQQWCSEDGDNSDHRKFCDCLQHKLWWLSIKSELTSGIVEGPGDCLQHNSDVWRMVTMLTTESSAIVCSTMSVLDGVHRIVTSLMAAFRAMILTSILSKT